MNARWKQFLAESKVEHVQNKVFYWASSKELPLGTVVNKSPPREHGGGQVEALFERVRQKVNPSAPSRLNCVFVCPEQGGFFCAGTGARPYVYEVLVTGDVFLTDGESWTEAVWSEGTRAISWAEQYWNPGKHINLPEILVSGKVVLSKKVKG